jgi:formate hydrogenlyase subunit 5
MKPETLKQMLETRFAADVRDITVSRTSDGFRRPVERGTLTATVDRDALPDLVAALSCVGRLHIACGLPAVARGDGLELIYPLTLFAGQGPRRELTVVLKTHLPADDLCVATLTATLPGAQIMEREAQEMFGVTVVGLADGRRMFTPDLPEGFFPQRQAPTTAPTEEAS